MWVGIMMENDKVGENSGDNFPEHLMAQSFEQSEQKITSNLDEDETEFITGQGFYRLAKVYYDKAQLDKAEEYFLKALEKTIFPRDSFAMLKIYGFLIRIHSEGLNEEQANKYIIASEELIDKVATELGSLPSEYFYYVGEIHTYKGNFKEAVENFDLAYQKAQQENEPELIAKSLYFLAQGCYQNENFEKALIALERLGTLLEILNKGYLKGCMYLLYAHIYREQGQLDRALLHYDKALDFLQKKHCWNLYSYILLGKGVTHKNLGDFPKALIFFDLALKAVDTERFKKLSELVQEEVHEVNDSSVDIYLDRHNRIVQEKTLGAIDFKHRFVLLEILFLLARNPGEPFNKDDLSRDIWKEEYNPLIHDKLIYTSISRLRKLIEPKNGTKYILRGKDGYTFNPRVNARFHKESAPMTQKRIGNIELGAPV